MGLNSSKAMEVNDSVKKFVDSVISDNKVVVFSKIYCPFCSKAKKVLEKYPILDNQYVVLEIEDRDDCNQIQEYLRQLTGASSVPRVFINGNFIGGGDDTVRLDSSGELGKRLEECQALKQKL
ncbi:glutaredoxin-1-like [Oppia nitens]|uniref:glutaredoxin-1-like n=1 Tax=Oppia nitens TaxID=1686743 RepID=UPI0023DADF94|nr:glutaredoxin-1-like [Oppia nitens]